MMMGQRETGLSPLARLLGRLGRGKQKAADQVAEQHEERLSGLRKTNDKLKAEVERAARAAGRR
jgi:hypothetical protein